MVDIDLEKLPADLRQALEQATKPAPERRDSIGVNFTYDPDDESSVVRGFKRGHLTADDLTSWGYDLIKLGLAKKDGDDDKGDDDKGDGGDGPRRRGYFNS